jgi:outer membrane protein assembly factor BamD (BamD/ComL family)
MMKPISSQTPSRLEHILRTSIQWIQTHRDQFWAISGTVAAAIILIFFMINRRQTQNQEAWVQLGAIQGALTQGQLDQASNSMGDWFKRFQGTSATSYAKFMQGDLLYRTTDYAGAARVYDDLAQRGTPKDLRPLALSALSSAEEMAGRLPQAQAAAQQLLDDYPDHFLAASMQFTVARLAELSGNQAGATALYDRFVVLYPQSPWTEIARARLQTLSPAAPVPVKK